jgi:type IV pilus assembly protein PilX
MKSTTHPVDIALARARSAGDRERGTALIMSLIILMILTILGITAISTSTLEEKMSGNVQEGTRAFEVAESGLQRALTDNTLYQQTGSPTANYSIDASGAPHRVSRVTSTFAQTTAPPRGSGFDANKFDAYHFRQQSDVSPSVDSANTGLNTTIVRGIAQIANKP